MRLKEFGRYQKERGVVNLFILLHLLRIKDSKDLMLCNINAFLNRTSAERDS